MSCNQTDFSVDGDKNNRLHDSIVKVFESSSDKCTLAASFFKDVNFLNYLKTIIGDKKPAEANKNDIKKAIRYWMRKNYPAVDLTATKIEGDTLQGFSSYKAKSIALSYTAHIMREHDIKARDKGISQQRVLNSISNRLKREFIENVAKPAYQTYLNDGGEHIEEIDTIDKELKACVDFLEECKRKFGTSDKIPANLRPEVKKRNARAKELDIIQRIAYTNFIINNGNIRERNFANMVNLVFSDFTNWITQALSLKNSVTLAKKYGYTITGEDLSYFMEYDEILFEEEKEGINEESRRFIDSSVRYKSFMQLIDDEIKEYISNIPNLHKLWDGKGDLPINNDNEMGLPTFMNAGFAINCILTRCNFAGGISGLTKSIEDLISNKKELYGLSVLVNEMKNNSDFARSIFHNLGNVVVTKSMIELGDYINFDRKNKEADAKYQLLFSMVNQAKTTIPNNFDINMTDIMRKKLRKADYIYSTNKEIPNKEELRKLIITNINKFFPGVDINAITSYIDSNDNNLIKFLLNTVALDDAAENLIQQINTKRYKDIDYSKLIKSISDIADLILPYVIVNTELNSVNAEGNQSSDAMDNNYLSNTLKQIQFGTEEDANAGLNNLLSFVKQSRQYDNSPIFYGVYDENGTEIIPGLFIRDAQGDVTVNPKAKDIISYSLFNGITNPLTGEGVMYNKMSRGDYFVSSLIAFDKPIRRSDSKSVGFNSAGYFMRIPSDAPKNFVIQAPIISSYDLIKDGEVNKEHGLFIAYKQVLKGEINNFIYNLNNIFENKDGVWKIKENKQGLFSNYHYKGDILENGKLTGQIFKFLRLHSTDNVNVNALIEDMLSIYGGAKKGLINKNGTLNTKRTDLIKIDSIGKIAPANKFKYNEQIDNFLDNYLKEIINNAKEQFSSYQDIVGDRYTEDTVINMTLNTNLMYSSFDDLFEGDSKFYKDPQTFLKRAKEVQAGGKSYDNWTTADPLGQNITKVVEDGKDVTYEIADRIVNARNGFRAITINNTVRPSDEAKTIKAKLIELGVNKDTINDIVSRFAGNTTTNDAQSYITIDELANRLFAKGKLKKYKPLLDKFLAKDENGKPMPVTKEDLDKLAKLGEKIQIQKNFYFDKQFDVNTGVVYPRQIKNAEFVLIPQLLDEDSSLRKLYDIMVEKDIGQINTAETDKAAKRYVLTFWDNDGNVSDTAYKEFVKELDKGAAIENYYYRYLYEQQQVIQHMEDEVNKAGIQILKKIIDNAGNYSKKVQDAVQSFFDNYCANIEESFNTFLDNMGWKVNEDNIIVNKDGSEVLNYTEFYKRGKEEAKRLGLDSQFLAFFDVDSNGRAILPNFENNVQRKFESIAQAMFNSVITRQKLPGWHAAQVTNVGIDKKLKYHKETTLTSDPNSDKAITSEIRLTPWFNMNVFAGKTNEEILAELKELGLDKMIIYRIPTEGKQSIAVGEVTDLLDITQGSTVIVPDEWVTQTGSDFDVDTVYGIQYTFKRNKKTGKLEKVTEGKDGRNNAILDAMITIMSDPTVIEENLSCSNFDEISKEIDFFNEANPEINKANQSCYDIFTQMTFMENATSGMTLKSFSVMRDNFNSINSYVKSNLTNGNEIKVEYNLNNYDLNTIKEAYDNVDTTTKPGYAIVTHNRLANSKNNRNVKGRLITVYSSQTTAHILDAIKTGAIFNENSYTFGCFKTLIDLGIDYHTAIAFLQQPAVTMIVENYNRNNSIYSDSLNYGNKPIHDTIRDIAKIIGIRIGGKEINEFTSIKTIQSALMGNKNLQDAFKRLFGVDLSINDNRRHNYISLNADTLISRLKRGKMSHNSLMSDVNNIYENLAYDLGMILFFDNLRNITNGIEKINKCCNPDKFGALQTVSATREKLDNITSIIWGTNNQASGLIEVNGVDFLRSLYPGFIEGDIDIEASVYSYLAAFLKYSTIPSVAVNSKLFYLEDDNIRGYINFFKNAIGKKLTEEQKVEFKEYLVSYVYNQVPVLIRPITIGSKGHLIIDRQLEKEQANERKEKNIADYWNLERNRILGYRVKENYNFEVKDLYEPTDEELHKYKLLTPVQKVNFIKSRFITDAGIFKYLVTNEYKGETTIKFLESTDDREALYKMMNEAFFNNNAFIKLAAVDLIKYALIAENGKYKRGAINKLITKEIRLANSSNFGLGLTDSVVTAYNEVIKNDPQHLNNIFDRFIRSHSTIVNNITLNKNNPLNKYKNGYGTFLIPATDKDTLSNINEYVRITDTVQTENGRKIKRTRLYKTEPVINNTIDNIEYENMKPTEYFLYPINILNSNEITEYSYNNENIKEKSRLWFNLLVSKPQNEFEAEIKNNPKYSVQRNIRDEQEISETFLEDTIKSSNKVQAEQAKHIVSDIEVIVNSPVKGTYQGLFLSNAYWLSKAMPSKGGIRQIININGERKTIVISKVNNKRLFKALKSPDPYAKSVYYSLTQNEQNILNKAIRLGITNENVLSLYGVTVIDNTKITDSIEKDDSASILDQFASSKDFIDSESNYTDEMIRIKNETIANGTFMKAPGGNPTNLNERQWLQVRTKNFINWFGDWINDKKHASKVLDENNEPLVVYHGTPNKWNIYNSDFFGSNTDEGDYGKGLYLSSIKNVSLQYGEIMPLFVNIRNPFRTGIDSNITFKESTRRGTIVSDFNRNTFTEELKQYDGVLYSGRKGKYEEIVVPTANQIKSAESNNGDFSTTNNDIYASSKSFIDSNNNIKQTEPIHDITTAILKDIIHFEKTTRIENLSDKGLTRISDFSEKLLKDLHNAGIDTNSMSSIDGNIEKILSMAANYYTSIGTMLLNRANKFILSDGREFSIDNENLYKNLTEDDIDLLTELMLDIKTFGNNINSILVFQPNSDNLNIKNAIEQIQNIINKVRNNTKGSKAFENMFNVYYANKSGNPIIKQGIINLRQAFGDINKLDLYFSAATELNNSQIQTVVKHVNNRLKKVELFDIPKARDSFKKRYKEIMAEPGDINFDKIVNKDGYLVRDWTDEFFTKRKELYERVKNIEPNTLEWHKAKLELEKFLAKNVHRRIKQHYYDSVNRLTETVLNKAGDLYTKWMQLNERLQNLNASNEFDTDTKIDMRKAILNEMAQLSSKYNEDLTEKTGEELNKANALNEFLKAKQELNRKAFSRTATKEFNDQLEYHTKIIENYDSKYPDRPLTVKLGDEKYANSYNWIQTNTIKQLNKTTRDKLNEAFATLKRDAEEQPNYIKSILKGKDVYDKEGNIDPTKISIEDAKKIKEYKESQFEENSFEPLIKNVPKNRPLFTKEYWNNLKQLQGGNTDNFISDINRQINAILKKVTNSGEEITCENLLKLSVEDLKELSRLYFIAQYGFTSENGNIELATFIKNNTTIATNDEAFNAELNYYLTNLKGHSKALLIANIIFKRNKDGEIIITDDGKRVPNPQIFNYRIPNDNYRDIKKEKAKQLINDNVQWETTEAYEKAEDLAYVTGTYNEWYESNHYYNPYIGEMVPLPYWTKMKINPNGTLDATYEQVPTFNNTESSINDDYINDNYNPESKINYNSNTGDYSNTNNLNKKELKMRNLFQEILDSSATNTEMKRAAERGFMPRQARTIINAKYLGTQIAGAAGITFGARQPDWTYDIDYSSEEDPKVPMMQRLKTKGYQQLPKKEDYIGREDEYNTKVKEIKENNSKLDAELMDRNWESVMDIFIQRSMLYNEKRKLGNQIQLLIEDLKSNKATTINWRGKPSAKSRLNDVSIEYNEEAFDNAIEFLKNYYHKLFRDEFKTRNKLNYPATLMQNITSAKYMIFNVTGGIANLATGGVNALAEVLASEYFDKSTMRKAMGEYNNNILTMIADQYKSTARTLTDGIIKWGNVVDIDAIIERSGNPGIDEIAKRIRDKGYFMQSGGEHIMQNTVFLAMLHSHRIYRDSSTGKMTYGSEQQYILQKEIEIFTSIIQNDHNMLQLFNNYKTNIKQDEKLQFEYGTFNADLVMNFVKANLTKEQQKEFIKKRNSIIKNAKEEFKTKPAVYDQFELVDGYAKIKQGSDFTEEMFADIVNKTISVNHRIHGVYDKIGAAYIEKYWWGSLLMQYHKHLYPMVKKLYRRRGYYNEVRGTIEKGAYQSLFKLTTQGFKDAYYSNKEMDNIVKRSIVSTVQGIVKCFTDLHFNYQSMPDWERANVRRSLASHLGVAAAILAVIALHASFDDDDFKENDFLATCLYQADRLATESFELNPIGLPSAFKTTWSSPVASLTGPQDAYKAIELISGALFDDEFKWDYTTGRYKGQNKLMTLVSKQIPIYRVYDRLTHMGQSNKFYRVGNSVLTFIPAKKIGNEIQGEE